MFKYVAVFQELSKTTESIKNLLKTKIILQNRYLASNPIQCDCKSKWLTRYLRKNQAIEKSDVRCHGPVSVQGWKVIRPKRFLIKIKSFFETKSTT